MKTSVLKKSLLDYAIKGKLSTKFRRENPKLSATDEICAHNEQITQTRNIKQKELGNLEKALKEKGAEKQSIKSQITALKKEIAKLTPIASLRENSQDFCGNPRHTKIAESTNTKFPFAIPNSWAWVRLGDICEISSGISTNDNLPILDVKYLRNKIHKTFANSGNMVFENDRLILMDGENSGEIFIATEQGFLGSTLKKLEYSTIAQNIFTDFLLLYYKDFFKENKKGAAIPHLDRKLFINLIIPLPPLAEQKAITQTLEHLFTISKGLSVE